MVGRQEFPVQFCLDFMTCAFYPSMNYYYYFFYFFIYLFFLVEAKVVVAKEWGNRVVGCRREVVKVEELKKQRKNRSTRTS